MQRQAQELRLHHPQQMVQMAQGLRPVQLMQVLMKEQKELA